MLSNPPPKAFPDQHICILGLGFVGLTLAAAFADAGFTVTGIEIRDHVLKMLESGHPHFFEPGLADHLQQAVRNRRLLVHKKIPANCPATVFIVTVGTPLDPQGKVTISSIQNVANEIAAQLKDGDMVILRSTVKLGTTRKIVAPILAATGKQFDLAFCPERTVEGQAMAELRYLPQVIGTAELRTSLRAAQLFQFLTPTILRVSNFETAEMIKLIDNAKRDVMFAYANEVARMCDAVGISAEEVISSGRFGYSRTNLPMPGPVGGPCLSKDSHILCESLHEYGITPEITLTARQVNERQISEVVQFLKNHQVQHQLPENLRVTVLGVAFKGQPATDDTRGSMAIPALAALRQAFPKGQFSAYDPVVKLEDIQALGFNPISELTAAFADTHLLIILNNHSDFARMSLEKLAVNLMRPALIYDFWNHFTRRALLLPQQVTYIALGSHQQPISGEEQQ